MTARSMKRWLGMGLSIGLVIGLAACGSDAKTAVTTTTAKSSTTTVPAPEVTATSTLDAALTKQLVADMDKVIAKYGPPGTVVGVSLPEQGKFVGIAGVGNLETKQPLTADMTWPLRSVTKAFTVTLVIQLVDDGKLSLDDTIETYTPDLPNASKITVRQLADMTSGLPEYTTKAWIEDYSKDPDRVFTNDELIAYAAAEPAQFAPGTKHVYTNTNTLVLGKIVEDVTGESFDAVLQARILDPLGLSHTTYATSEADWPQPHPTGYQPVDGTLEAQGNNFSVFGPAGAVVSTLADLEVFAPALANGTLLTPAGQAERAKGAELAEGPEYDQYALGIGELDGWWGHTGEGFGFTVVVMGKPGTQDSVVIFMNISNLGDHAPTKLMREIAATLADNG